MPLHDRLRHARQRAGLSGAQVRDRIGIGESSLSDFENGKREPSLRQLQKLADVYRRSVSFFFAEGPIAAEPAVLWRIRPQENAEEIEVRFLRLCEQYHNLEMWCDEWAPVSLPQATGDPARFGYSNAEELAKQVRRDLQLGDRPGQCLLAVLEEVCGVKVFHLAFEPSGTAASAVSETFGAAVLLNANNARWRRNHDLAHELFHLLTWSLFHPVTNSPMLAGDSEEKLATTFASNLLMPSEPFGSAINSRDRGGKITFESLFDIAREFDVPVESVLWRMHIVHNRGRSNSDLTKEEIDKAKRLAPLLEERESPKPHPWPARYRSLAIKSLRRGEVAIGRFAEYLNISRHEAMQFVEQEAPEGLPQSASWQQGAPPTTSGSCEHVDREFASVMKELVKAHATVADQDVVSSRALGSHQRAALIESACAAAAAFDRSRLAAGLPTSEPAPWPSSTWDFLRKNAAAHVRT